MGIIGYLMSPVFCVLDVHLVEILLGLETQKYYTTKYAPTKSEIPSFKVLQYIMMCSV